MEGKDGALTGAAPGFRASLSVTGRGGIGITGGFGLLDSTTITISGPVVNIKPDSDDNPVNVNNRGVLPVAVYGVDPTIFPDPMLLTLAGATPLRYSFENGVLNLQYDSQRVVAGLGPLADGEIVELPLAYMVNPSILQVIDCDFIRVLKKGKSKPHTNSRARH